MPSDAGITKNHLVSFFQKMAFMAEAKEWNNLGHVERIRHYVMILATGAGLPFSEAETLSVASILHDIGKSMIPEDLLNRKGNFNPDEWRIVEQHTAFGKSLLDGNGAYVIQTAQTVAFSHHERWDGSGYPQKLAKQEIPFPARVCALADVFDALTTQRSYKQPVATNEAYQLIVDSSRTLFDPDLVSIFQDRYKDIQAVKRRYE